MSKRTRQLQNENNRLEEAILPEDDRVLTDMVVYIRGSVLSNYEQEQVRHDLVQMVLEGESRGESIREVIGEDYKTFCQQVIEEMPKRTLYERILSGVGNTCLYLLVLAVIWFCFGGASFLADGNKGGLLPVTAGNLFSAVLILATANGFVLLLSKKSFDGAFLKSKKFMIGFLCMSLLCICVNYLCKTVLFQVSFLAALIGIAILFGVYKLLDEKFN